MARITSGRETYVDRFKALVDSITGSYRRRLPSLAASPRVLLSVLLQLVSPSPPIVDATVVDRAFQRGIVNAFGVYQTYYETELLSTTSSSDISWIGSIQAFLLVFIGVVTGPIFDLGYLRYLLLTGGFMTVFGIMMTSISTQYYQVLLAQGICIGLGSGCLFIPSIAIVATYFTERRALATGIAVSGSSIGGIVYPMVFRRLLPLVGFGWATRTLGFISLLLLCVSVAVMKSRSGPKRPRSLWIPSAFRRMPYTLHTVGVLLAFIGLYFPLFYIQSYALTVVSIRGNLAFDILAILNGASVFGRILPNFLADKVGPMNMLVPCTLFSGILCLCWIAIKDVSGIVVLCVLYGFFSGAFVSLIPAVVAKLTPDMAVVGTWMGMSLAIGALGLLIGNPIGGALVNVEQAVFYRAQAFCGASIVLGSVLIFMARMIRAREQQSWRV
ncbi:hypothetical protein MMC13_004981 [Lambiella insularis]|nr:hypothetical protein [Lambiella insularis]